MRNYILLAVSIVAGITAFMLTKMNLDREYKRLELKARKIRVLAPKKDLLQGDTITPEALGVRRIYQSHYTGQQIKPDDLNLIVGQRLANDVKRADYLLWRDIDMPQLGHGRGLAGRIKNRERAVSISVDNVSAVSGLVRPNDHVDIVGTFRFPGEKGVSSALDTVTLTLLQNVTVLAVGQQLAGGHSAGSRGRSYSTVTLNVSPQEAELLVFAQQKGQVTLTLRNPRDVYVDHTPDSVNFNTLQREISRLVAEREKRMKTPK